MEFRRRSFAYRDVLIGVPLPICSCGVIPIATALRKAGAGKGPTAGFLIATPQTGIDSILATYALLGPVFAIARPIAAFLTGIIAGAVLAGALVNLLPDALPAGFSALALQERAPSAVNHISGGVLALIMSNAFLHPPMMR